MRAIVGVFLTEFSGGCQETSMATHDDADVDTRDGAVVEVNACEGLRDEFGGAAISWTVVGHFKVIVDGFWNMNDA